MNKYSWILKIRVSGGFLWSIIIWTHVSMLSSTINTNTTTRGRNGMSFCHVNGRSVVVLLLVFHCFVFGFPSQFVDGVLLSVVFTLLLHTCSAFIFRAKKQSRHFTFAMLLIWWCIHTVHTYMQQHDVLVVIDVLYATYEASVGMPEGYKYKFLPNTKNVCKNGWFENKYYFLATLQVKRTLLGKTHSSGWKMHSTGTKNALFWEKSPNASRHLPLLNEILNRV